MIVFIIASSKFILGGSGVMVAYGTVAPMARVRFPPNFEKVRIKMRSLFRLQKQSIGCLLCKQGFNSSLTLTISRNINYGGSGVMVAYGTVAPMARVRFPPAALDSQKDLYIIMNAGELK